MDPLKSTTCLVADLVEVYVVGVGGVAVVDVGHVDIAVRAVDTADLIGLLPDSFLSLTVLVGVVRGLQCIPLTQAGDALDLLVLGQR